MGLGLFGGKAPAFAQGVTLHMLQHSNFASDIDIELKKMADEFGAANNCKVEIELIGINDVLPRTFAAIESKNGPDVVLLTWNQAQLFGDRLADLGDVIKSMGGNKVYKFNREAVTVDHVYRGVPFYNNASAMTYNKRLCDSFGIAEGRYAKTYDELRVIGRKMKKAGKPIGWCLGHTLGDGAIGNYPILWAFGGAEVDEKGRVIINSKQTRAALNFMRAFWKDACDETGMGWNDASNNQAYLSEASACVLNAASIYVKMRRDAKLAKEKGDEASAKKWADFADNTRHTAPPAGPAGRFALVQPYSYHVPAYTPNLGLAKSWLKYILAPKQYERIFLAGAGFAQGYAPEWDAHPFWDKDPLIRPFREINKYGRNMGFKGPFSRGASEAQAKYIIADMMARAIQTDVDSAVKWAEGELKIAYQKKA